MQKNLPVGDAYVRIFVRLWFDLSAWFQFLIKGKPQFTLAISKAHFHFFKQLGKTAKKRDTVQIPMNALSGVYKRSIVWAYFIKKIKTFNQLRW